ncbi:TPA: lytic murein transglycosylase [Stenotrophomonas maltophilia]|nr:lytic murein transglycosylase [Stenotrophomonas maltophilia]
MSSFPRCLLALACAGAVGAAQAATPPGPQIVTTDASRFYALYDSTGGKPSVAQLAAYLAEGSPGLGELAKARRVTPERMAEAIASQPGVYAQGRSCLAELPAVKQRLVQVFGNLQAIYPQAAFPPVTLAVGRGRPVGLTSKSGVIIGLEALCAADFMNPNVQDRFVHVIAHEYVHIQQTGLIDFEPGDPHATVLRVSLGEGIAEFIAELISGNVGNSRHAAWTRGREVHIESAFALDVDSTDLSPWLYNYKPGSQEPYDLGYWVGYRIAKAYYLQAKDKRDAVRALIQQDNPKAILAASGWTPGMWMPANVTGVAAPSAAR